MILALGSDILMDEAVAIVMAKDLKQLFPDFDLRILPLGGIGLIELIAGFEIVIIIDTMISHEKEIGAMTIINDFQTAALLHLQNPHDVDFENTIRLAEKLGYNLPKRIIILAINIKQNLVASSALSRDILRSYDKLLRRSAEIIKDLLQGIDPS